MKKVLFVIYSYSLGGGAERILSDVVSCMDSKEYEIVIQPYADFGVLKENLPPYVKLNKGIVDMKKASSIEKAIKYFLVHFFPDLLRKIYIREQYDYEISFNYQIPSFLVKETGKTKVLEWNHGDIYDLKKSALKKKLQERSYRRATKIVAISENTKQSICDLFPQFEDKIELIYNGVNRERIERKSKEKTNIILKEPAILFLGRLEEAKQPLLLLEALKDLIEEGKIVNLYFLGKGELETEMRKKISEWGLQEHAFLLGYQKNPYPIIKQSKAICMMSKAEGFPTVFTEGMVLGKPFISSDVGGVKELSNHGKCGIIVDNVQQCANAIEKVVLNDDLNKQMGKICQEYVQEYSMEKQVEHIQKLLD